MTNTKYLIVDLSDGEEFEVAIFNDIEKAVKFVQTWSNSLWLDLFLGQLYIKPVDLNYICK